MNESERGREYGLRRLCSQLFPIFLTACGNGMYQAGILQMDRDGVRQGVAVGLAQWNEQDEPQRGGLMCGLEAYIGRRLQVHSFSHEGIAIGDTSSGAWVLDETRHVQQLYFGAECYKTVYERHEGILSLRLDWGAGGLLSFLLEQDRTLTFVGEVEGIRKETDVSVPGGQTSLQHAYSALRPGVYYGIVGLNFPVKLGVDSEGKHASLGVSLGGWY